MLPMIVVNINNDIKIPTVCHLNMIIVLVYFLKKHSGYDNLRKFMFGFSKKWCRKC